MMTALFFAAVPLPIKYETVGTKHPVSCAGGSGVPCGRGEKSDTWAMGAIQGTPTAHRRLDKGGRYRAARPIWHTCELL